METKKIHADIVKHFIDGHPSCITRGYLSEKLICNYLLIEVYINGVHMHRNELSREVEHLWRKSKAPTLKIGH